MTLIVSYHCDFFVGYFGFYLNVHAVDVEWQTKVEKYGTLGKYTPPELCEDKYNFWWKPEAYQKESITVGFGKDMSKESALGILENHGYKTASNTVGDSIFDSLGYLRISVPSGQEIKGLCELKYDDQIKSVELNPVVGLP